MLREVLSTAAALAAAFALGYGYRGERDRLRPKTLKRLMREQRVRPVRSADDLAAPEGERLSDEEFETWTAAMREAREG